MLNVTISGNSFEISGEQSDPYFHNSQGHINGFDRIIGIVRALPSGSTIIDVGANIGLSSITIGVYAPQCKIISFEPSPINFAHLEKNVRSSGLANIALVQAAVSNKPGILHFHDTEPDEWSGAWSHVVSESHINQNAGFSEVKSIALDDLEFDSVSFLKIDVEGHEPEVLAGASALISRFGPTIFMEFNPWTINAYGGHSPAAFAKALFESFEIEDQKSALSLLNSTICSGTQADLCLRLKTGATVPTLEEMSYPTSAVRELERLRHALSSK
jgi:FkbM family methyltransferase